MVTNKLNKRLAAPSWSYAPDCRHNQVESKVAELALHPEQARALDAYLFQERDPVLRQAVRFRLTGSCACPDIFAWAYEVFDTNPTTGMASALKAMTVADRFPEEIAEELSTNSINVVVFEKLFWDVRPLLDNESLLRAVVAPEFQSPALSVTETRDRFMLRTALAEGWPGLRAFLHGDNDSADDSAEVLAAKIEAAAGRRALRFLKELDASGAVASEEDLKRFAVLRSLRSREAATNASEQENRCREFGRAFVALVSRQQGETPDPKNVKTVARYLPIEASSEDVVEATPCRRRRRSFAG